jgi:2-keto-4-pentenoate hydratase/2-oxohepta-3-ene-1,7-dioic acid hydratase in catechol pathway
VWCGHRQNRALCYPGAALDYVYGYTTINDASARDFQFATSQWAAGKMGDTLAPVGLYIADKTEVVDPHVLDLNTCWTLRRG